jgi:hypothetical protein
MLGAECDSKVESRAGMPQAEQLLGATHSSQLLTAAKLQDLLTNRIRLGLSR